MRKEERERYLKIRREEREKYQAMRKARWAAKKAFYEKKRQAKQNAIDYKRLVPEYLDSQCYTIREIQGSNLIHIGDHRVSEELENPILLLSAQVTITCKYEVETSSIEEGKLFWTAASL
eukprot:TRINITY_DN7302_c0_g1_i1.p1 TRINITY_DN7302_c0_g1~~TRINITY_DN7302_c0_g1_i1.p1  ORF type:complete len:120 (-),score=18.33 TRINITY_DN7302_c0_g1_i1:402-761(-)